MELLEAFPYQKEGAKFLATMPHALLADEMGLGKSCQAVLAADLVGARNILVLCPASVRFNWAREFERFSPVDRPCSVVLTGRHGVPKSGVVVCSYDLVSNEKTLQTFKSTRWDAIVLDEAHYLKSRTALRTKAVYGHGSRSPGLAACADRVWRLTGTPAPNDASELYTHLKSAGLTQDPYWDFVFRYCTGFNSDYGFRITGHKNTEELKALLAKFMLRRKKDEVMKELPPISYQEVTVERSAVSLDEFFFEQMRGKTLQEFNAELKTADQALRMALDAIKPTGYNAPAQDRLKLLESLAKNMVTLRRYIGIAKVPNVCEILIEELEANPALKLVVFAVHRDVIEQTRVRLAKYGAVTFYGGTDPLKKKAHLARFQSDPKCRVFIGNVQAAGTGVDGLQKASSEVVFMEADWVPSNNAQAAMRCHRIGQERPVRVRFFSCQGSVDEQIQQTLLRKTRELTKLF